MSPEQAAGRVDEHNYATDVYSLGAILYTIVAGQPTIQSRFSCADDHASHPSPRADGSHDQSQS